MFKLSETEQLNIDKNNLILIKKLIRRSSINYSYIDLYTIIIRKECYHLPPTPIFQKFLDDAIYVNRKMERKEWISFNVPNVKFVSTESVTWCPQLMISIIGMNSFALLVRKYYFGRNRRIESYRLYCYAYNNRHCYYLSCRLDVAFLLTITITQK